MSENNRFKIGKNQFVQIFSLFNDREKIELLGIFLLTLSAAIIEMIGVGLIFPFIGIISRPSVIHEKPILQFFYKVLPVNSERQFFIWCGLGLLAVIILKNCYYAIVLYVQQNYLIKKRVHFTTLLYQDYLRRPYTFHLQNNSAMLLRNLNQVDGVFSGLLQPVFQIMTDVLIIISITILLFYSNTLVTLGAMFLVGLPALWSYRFLGGRFRRRGEDNHKYIGITSKIILEGFGGIKEIQVMERGKVFVVNLFQNAVKLGNVRRDQEIMNQIPRLMLEVIMSGSLIFIIIYLLWQKQTLTNVLPTLGLFSVAAFRLMASINKVVAGLHRLQFSRVLQETVCVDLRQIKSKHIDLDVKNITTVSKDFLKDCIKLQHVSYRYPGTNKDAIHKVSVIVHKGASVAFVGASGAGKSTLVDIFLGLLSPYDGTIAVDGRNIQEYISDWRQCIGYIPQEIFLCDDTLRRNIAFGIPDELIDESAVQKASQASQLEFVIKQLPKGLDTLIGERGVRLSGGQRQRIAIARALYHDPDVLVMDEATSALDGETEAEVASAIELLSGKKTIIVIAHRLATVKKCDCVYFMIDGEIRDSGRYEELIERNPRFRKMAGLQYERRAVT